ncbi:DUF4142 domain-containing protein [Myxococcus sp. Y35]|uniref:DUF4142 domain-containing protein n=1 Tax=Pseudomyxococcus flavus TaxID=3115648 RepID=UPI003CF84F64
MAGRLGSAGGAAVLAAMLGAAPLAGLTPRAEARQARVTRDVLAERDLLLAQLALFDANAIASANLALEKSSNPQVRQLAMRMVDDHRQHLEDLKRWGGSPSMDIVVAELTQPRGEQGMGGSGGVDGGVGQSMPMQRADARLERSVGHAQQHLDVLREAQGPTFDKVFLKRVVEDQENGLRLVKQGQATYKNDGAFALMLDRTGNLADRFLQRARGLQESLE